ncbi:biliverdin-producing heme oxygenase [Autumnicola musiva]|uniref:Biliverdin-producing heme oxygenase n=1 Tax=Autumnicola musiva TaxID=3075589 RepID=A0ABU3D7J4_9FLAO|nr:biliverdin-producing heme oxygenase [Zunongwangia sp. F117]MDT0677504.1 biliverdin-producing heme oxygenase [Zunongwangia sp. F117]
MLNNLREATAVLHEQLEKENAANLIMDHNITLEQYRELLFQNYIAYYIAEKQISSQLSHYQESKHRALEQDLRALGIPREIPQSLAMEFYCNSKAEAYGAAYVVEGSVMGGMLIAKNLQKCPGLSEIKTHHFFNGKRDNIKSWRGFVKKLEESRFNKQEVVEATNKAKETFLFFSKAFKQPLPVT